MPGGAVHHHGQSAAREQGKQNVQDILRSELQIMKDPRHDPRLGVERSTAGEVQSDLAVKGRFGLEDPKEHFSELQQRVSSAAR